MKVREVRVRVRKIALSKKCIELLMAEHAGRARKGVCLNVKEGLMAKQTNITLEEQEQEMGLNQSFDQKVKFPEKNMEFIVGSRHRKRS